MPYKIIKIDDKHVVVCDKGVEISRHKSILDAHKQVRLNEFMDKVRQLKK